MHLPDQLGAPHAGAERDVAQHGAEVGLGSQPREGLVGVPRGSRVLVIAPPEFGYGEGGNPQAGIGGTDTLAFVVDILGVG